MMPARFSVWTLLVLIAVCLGSPSCFYEDNETVLLEGQGQPDGASGGDDASDGGTDDLPAEDPLAGVYAVRGTDAHLGPFTGHVEFTPREDGLYDFVRVVTYPDMEFETYNHIETAWNGKAAIEGEAVTIWATLKQGHWMRAYKGIERTEAQREPVVVTGGFRLAKGSLDGLYKSDPAAVEAAETMTFESENGTEPIWKNEDSFYESHNELPDWARRFLNAFLGNYHALPLYDEYRDRPEFRRYMHFTARFRSDLDFYRRNPRGLRVINKVVDEISLAETARRSDAFRYTIGEKAEFFEHFTKGFTINEHGMIADYIGGTEPPEHVDQYDSLLWTGTYVAAQGYRYMVTGEEEALDNMLFSLDGVIKCVEVTGDPTTFARTLRTAPYDETDYPAWNPGAPGFEGIEWRCCGNNDMFHGIGYAYAVALLALPDDPEYDGIRERMETTTISLIEHSPEVYNNDFNRIIMNWTACAMGLGDQYCAAYETDLSIFLELWLRIGNGLFFMWGVSDWSGQHLNTVGMLNLALLADITGDWWNRRLIRQGFGTGMRLTKRARQPLFTIAAFGLGNTDPDDAEILEDAIWAMREVPYPKRNVPIDMRVDATWCASPLPSLFWKFDWEDGGRHQGLYGTPWFMHGSTSCLWKDNPYQVDDGEDIIVDNAADYLHGYWLGRWTGVITGGE